ncbi:MAG: AAA family ATPase [Arthrospira sp. PLM2.Bin9]|nr:ribulose bisphosphate carboxylase small subunit [Arthrospira sp. PLM2.Bin9]TVU55119.1 MAG: AAA family ATPase [Arthrospira sp. PLM2.Bin9]
MSYYISPRFLDKVSVHITKNFLDLPQIKVPLILGIHGRKGEGKTFQCELIFKKMGIEPVMISGGELESPDAGDPSRLLRLRYREAAEQVRVQGKMCAIFINDFDAGAGRFDSGTQYTVNTQLVNATLMNIADNPTNVQLPGSYDDTPLHRIPIIITGNDFSTLYAPLIRDGRMDKFYWEPNRDDRIAIVQGIFGEDSLSDDQIVKLVDEFSGQAIDFFSAMRSRIYDEQIREFIYRQGLEKISRHLVNSVAKPPQLLKPNFTLYHLVESGRAMVKEQEQIQKLRLVEEYNQFPTVNSRPTNSNPQPINQPHLPHNPVMPAHAFDNSGPSNWQGDSTSSTTFIDGHTVSSKLSLDILEQVQKIRSGGYQIGLEYADQRHFKTGSWKSCAIIDGDIPEAIASVENCLSEHRNEYVRLLGIDPKQRRRVVENIIQRPS